MLRLKYIEFEDETLHIGVILLEVRAHFFPEVLVTFVSWCARHVRHKLVYIGYVPLDWSKTN